MGLLLLGRRHAVGGHGPKGRTPRVCGEWFSYSLLANPACSFRTNFTYRRGLSCSTLQWVPVCGVHVGICRVLVYRVSIMHVTTMYRVKVGMQLQGIYRNVLCQTTYANMVYLLQSFNTYRILKERQPLKVFLSLNS